MIVAWVVGVVLAAIFLTLIAGTCKVAARAGRQTPPMPVDQRLRAALRAEAFALVPEPGMPDGITWPGDCTNCVWWEPAPSEAEDAIAVYRPCALHDPVLWAEMERRYAQ